MTTSFGNPLARGTSGVIEKARTIKAWTRALLDLPEDAVVSVNELVCSLPGCPPKETVILVMQEAMTRQVSIHLAIIDVTQADIVVAFGEPTA